jgi:lipoyl(octanoyl) transferase
MALDEAILEAAGSGKVPPTLRLYAWYPACLSLGYAQAMADVDLGRLETLGWQLVRRPTGGKAILHTDELTYSVTGPLNEPRLTGSVLESYRRLSRALIQALRLLGIAAQAEEKPDPGNINSHEDPICFEVPSNYEITLAGKKLIGSAQARRKEGVLQHGSLPLYGDLSRIVAVLRFPDQATRQAAGDKLLSRATTASTARGQPIDWEQAAQAFIDAFQQTLELDLQSEQPTPAELQRATELVAEKYRQPSWTGKF